MVIRAFATILFGGIFGMALIVAGIQRFWKARHGPGKLESAFWGIVGIAMGVAMLAGVVWIMTPAPHDREPDYDPANSPLIVPTSQGN